MISQVDFEALLGIFVLLTLKSALFVSTSKS